jgi:putative membrane protein
VSDNSDPATPSAPDSRPRGPNWFREGEDPDYRFSLANERTFLSWIRTSLALIAGAVAVVQLIPPFRVPGGRGVLGVVLALTGLLTAATAYFRWAANERAMRRKEPLPYSGLLLTVAAALSATGVVVVILVLFERH